MILRKAKLRSPFMCFSDGRVGSFVILETMKRTARSFIYQSSAVSECQRTGVSICPPTSGTTWSGCPSTAWDPVRCRLVRRLQGGVGLRTTVFSESAPLATSPCPRRPAPVLRGAAAGLESNASAASLRGRRCPRRPSAGAATCNPPAGSRENFGPLPGSCRQAPLLS